MAIHEFKINCDTGEVNSLSVTKTKLNLQKVTLNPYEIEIITDGLRELLKTQQETSDPNIAWRMTRARQILARLEGGLNK